MSIWKCLCCVYVVTWKIRSFMGDKSHLAGQRCYVYILLLKFLQCLCCMPQKPLSTIIICRTTLYNSKYFYATTAVMPFFVSYKHDLYNSRTKKGCAPFFVVRLEQSYDCRGSTRFQSLTCATLCDWAEISNF